MAYNDIGRALKQLSVVITKSKPNSTKSNGAIQSFLERSKQRLERCLQGQERIHYWNNYKKEYNKKQISSSAYAYKLDIKLPVDNPYGEFFVIQLDNINGDRLIPDIDKKRFVAYKRKNQDLVLGWRYNGDKYYGIYKNFFSSNHPPVHIWVKIRQGEYRHLITFCGTNGYGPPPPAGIKPENVANKWTYIGSQEYMKQLFSALAIEPTIPKPKKRLRS